jgi:4,5-DOPA dioxygenase extradiol
MSWSSAAATSSTTWGNRASDAYDWARRFEDRARALLAARDFAPLVAYESLGRDAQLSAPTPEHYLPLVYVLAQYRDGDTVTFPVEGFDGGSISMLSVAIG